MKQRISTLMDGEHDPDEFMTTLEALRAPGESLETWRSYHLISDALRDTRLASPGFAERVNARILEEPTVLSRSREPADVDRKRWMPLYAAASFAAVALVGWIAFSPQQGADVLPVATTPSPVFVALPAAPQEPVQLPLTDAANDYLLAHQAFSPRNSFQGVAPYVRTVAAGRKQ